MGIGSALFSLCISGDGNTTDRRLLREPGNGKNGTEITVISAKSSAKSSPVSSAKSSPVLRPSQMNQIIPGLWLGSSAASIGQNFLKHHDITYILTVAPAYVTPKTDIISTFPAATPFHDGQFWRLVIPVWDLPTQNLIQHFENTNTFIHAALDAGANILVHCAAGASRSATVVTAYLMRTYRSTARDALERVREWRPAACPNVGFWDQLLVYEACGYNPSDQIEYVHWKLRFECGAVIERPANEFVAFELFSPGKPGVKIPDEIPFFDTASVAGDEDALLCTRCEKDLAPMKSVLPYEDVEQFYLGQPMDWMKPELDNRIEAGTLNCPGCEEEVGKYNWNGRKDERGRWVTPAFYLARDLVTRRGSGDSKHDSGII
jgi:dual specificity phosphatase 12